MHTHFKIVFKWAVHFITLAITRFNSAKKFFQATINTTTLRATRTTYPLLKLKHSILLVMYIAYNAF